MTSPFFSIVMPVYNRESLLDASITSVLKQTNPDFELICVNDGSNDNSEGIIKRYATKDHRIKYINQNKQGRCIARNTGIKYANGKWICFLDSDDIYFENHLQVFYDLIKQHPDQNAFATDQLIGGNKKKYKSSKLNHNTYFVTLKDSIFSNPISLNQLCYSYNKTKLIFPNEDIPISEDWLFIRLLTLHSTILKINITTNNVIQHTGRTMIKSNSSEIVKWNKYAALYFINSNNLDENIKNKIYSHTLLLCANIFLSDKQKRSAWNYWLQSIKYSTSITNILFYKALIKFILY